MRNKSPAFQFYPKDWLTSDEVTMMSNEERGEYITLLCYDWINNGISEDMYDGCSEKVQRCFNRRGVKYYNKRLVNERKKQRAWRDKCSDAGKKSADLKKRSKQQGDSSKVSLTKVATVVDVYLQLNVNIAVCICSLRITSLILKDSKDLLFQLRDLELVELLITLMQQNNEKQKPLTDSQYRKWTNDMRLMRERDGHTHDEIAKVIAWSQTDGFWKENILSTKKLRGQFAVLWAKAKNAEPPKDEYIPGGNIYKEFK